MKNDQAMISGSEPESTMKRIRLLAAEVVALGLCMLAIDLLFARTPAFADMAFIPWTLPAIWLAALHGAGAGFAGFGFCAVLVVACSPFLHAALGRSIPPEYWGALPLNAGPVAAATLFCVFLSGDRHRRDKEMIRALRERLRERTSTLSQRSMELDGLLAVYHELDERLGKSEELLTTLYQYVRKLNRHNVRKNLEGLASMLHVILRVKALTVYRMNDTQDVLVPVVVIGKARTQALPVAGTVEGWVVRNNQNFSVRMLIGNRQLAELDEGRSLICQPLLVENAAWGVVNIEDMDFIKYNSYSEKLLEIILRLAAASLKQANEFENLVRSDDIDELSGLPLFSQFRTYLEHEIRKSKAGRSSLSVVILEISNSAEIASENNEMGGRKLVRELASRMFGEAKAEFQVFMHEREDRLAFVCPGKDSDGISLFSLELLAEINGKQWIVNDKLVNLEVALGFASLGAGTDTPASMLDRADALLAVQRQEP